MKKEMKQIIRKGVNKLLKSGSPDVTNWKEFFLLIITYLSFNRKIDLIKVKELSVELSMQYNMAMDSLDKMLGDTFDVLGLLENSENFVFSFTTITEDKKRSMKKTIKEIEKLKEFKNGKGSKNQPNEVIEVSRRN